MIKATGDVIEKKYNIRPLLSCKKLFATAFTQTNNWIVQNMLFQTLVSGLSGKERYTTKMGAAMYNNMPYKVCFCLNSSKKSFCNKAMIWRFIPAK
jgi:hypothetical protein